MKTKSHETKAKMKAQNHTAKAKVGEAKGCCSVDETRRENNSSGSSYS